MRVPAEAIIVAALLLACRDKASPDETGLEPGDTHTSDTAGSDSGEPAVESWCADGSFGSVNDPDSAIFVRAEGSDEDGAGTLAAPYATVAFAMDRARALGSAAEIALGPGTLQVQLALYGDVGDGTSDDGLALHGCPGETVLVPPDDDHRALSATGVLGLDLAGFTIEGGLPPLLWAGTTATIADVEVVATRSCGWTVEGGETLVEIADMVVRDPVVETVGELEVGLGLLVKDATVSIEGGSISGATTAAVVLEGATATISDLDISATAPASDGTLGRGVQVQGLSAVSLSGLSVTGCSDAGVFSVQSLSLSLEGSTIDGTHAAVIAGSEESSGDGVAITQGTGEYDPSLFVTSLTGNTVTTSARAGIVIQDVVATLEGNTAGDDNGLSSDGTAVFWSGAVAPSGSDASNELDEPLELSLEALDIGFFSP